MSRLFNTLTLVIALSFLSGCISLMNGSKQQVSITSDPSGALAEINGQKCTTPCKLVLKRSSKITTIYLTPDGQPTFSETVAPAITGPLWHDFVALIEGYMIIPALIELSLNDFLYNWPSYIHVTYTPQANPVNLELAKSKI